MDLRARNKLRSKLNSKEWITKGQERQKCLKQNRTINLPSKKMRVDKVDKFCWICHTLSKQGKVCSQCPRVYHAKCLRSPTFFDADGACTVCRQESIIGDKEGFSCSRLKELLMYSIDKVLVKKKQLKETFCNWPEHENNDKLCKIVDINYYCQELISNSYQKPIEFLADFKWLYHNSCIIYGDKSKYALGAEQLVKELHKELSSLEACTDCYFYRNSNAVDEGTFFTLTCSKPHAVIWAKVKGYTYWPAKCLKVTKNGSAHIVFFGTHEVGYVPASMWFSLTSQPSSARSQQGLYSAAILEFLKYNENLQEKHFLSLQKEKTFSLSDVKKVSVGTQTSEDIQDTSMYDENNIEPEVLCVTSIENFQEVSESNKSFIDVKPDLIGSFPANQLSPEIASVSMSFCQEDTDSTKMSEDEDIQELLFIPKKTQNEFNRTDTESIQLCDNEDMQELPLPKVYHCQIVNSLQTSSIEDIHEPNVSDDGFQPICSRFYPEVLVSSIQSSLNRQPDIPTAISNPISEQFASKYLDNFMFSNDKQFVTSKAPSETPIDFTSMLPNNLKDNELTEVNKDTATLAKIINTDPQFSRLFHEKTKELIESMMVHMWTKMRDATFTAQMDKARSVKQIENNHQELQALEEREKQLKSRLNNADFLVQCLKRDFQNQVKVIEDRDKILSEMKTKLASIKTEKAEITEKYRNMEKLLNGPSST